MNGHTFPTDLLEAQTAWYITYRQLATAAPGAGAAHRRRLLRLSRLITSHPYWQTSAGTPAARMALKELARESACP
ncbi:hypothetical protein ABZ626_18795 [Streptomyces longispororuber]|uniref:hypothetical protein n=1 Tax=Streptomyces longispororuber TaxID=68230 RepID=UPI0033D98E02